MLGLLNKNTTAFSQILTMILISLMLSGCSGGGGAGIDSLVGAKDSDEVVNAPLVFEALLDQVVLANSPMAEVNPQVTSQNGLPVTYTCHYDFTKDGGVSSTSAASCSDLLGTGDTPASFSTSNGALTWTPAASIVGRQVEFKISATDGKASAFRIFSVTVNRPAPAVDKSVVTVSSSTLNSGESRSVTLTGYDSAGIRLNHGGAIIQFFNIGGSSAGTWSAVTDHGDGTYSATFTGTVSGTATSIRATIQGQSLVTSTPTFTVSPGPISAARSLITVSSGSVASGLATNVALQAKDAFGNNLSVGGATVVFSRSGGTSSGTVSSTTDLNNGLYVATFTGALAGTATVISASINGSVVTTTLPTITVTAGAISYSQSLVTVSNPLVSSGSLVQLTLIAKDALGNLIQNGGLAVVFSATGGTSTGTLSSALDNGDGTYGATFTGLLPGTAKEISATVGGNFITSTAPTLQVLTGSISAARSLITTSANSVVSGQSVVVTLQALDSNGNQLTTGGSTVQFTQSGGTSSGTFSAVVDHGNGTYTASFTGVLSGAGRVLGGLINGTMVTSVLPSVLVTPGIISASTSTLTTSSASVVSGNAITLTLTGRDSAGNRLVTGGSTVLFSRSGGTSTGLISVTTDNGDGTYSATFTGVVAGTATTVGATIGGLSVSSTLPWVQVTVGAISMAQSTVSLSNSTVAAGSTVGITLQARDGNGNNLTSGGALVSFITAGGSSGGQLTAVVDSTTGTYTATFTGSVAGSASTLIATINGSPLTSTAPTIQVLPGPVSLSQSTVTSAQSSVVAGASTTFTLQAKDALGNNLTSGGLVVLFNTISGTSTGQFSAVTDNLDGTYGVTFSARVSGTPTWANASVGGAAITNYTSSVQVLPGPISLAHSIISTSSTTVVSGSNVLISLQAKDAYGNNLSAGGASVLFAQAGGTSTGTFSAVSDHANGTYSASFVGVNSGSATNINATVNAMAVTSTPVPQLTVVPGNPASLEFYVQPTNSTTPMAVLATQPIVRLLDSNGNVITSGTNSNSLVALSLVSISGTASLGGSATMNAVAGVADFSGKGLYISSVGSYRIKADVTSLALSVSSPPISVIATTPVLTSVRPITISQNGANIDLTINRANYATTDVAVFTGTIHSTSTATPTVAAVTATGSVPALPANPVAVATDITSFNATANTINVTGANTNSCHLLGAFSAIPCSTSYFNLSYDEIVNANTSGGQNFVQINDGYVDSNRLPVEKYTVAQAANISGSTNADFQGGGSNSFNYISPYSFADKVFFLANYNSYSGPGNLGLVSMDNAGRIKFEAKVQPIRTSGTAGDDKTSTILDFNGALYFRAGTVLDATTGASASAFHLFKFSPAANHTTTGALERISPYEMCDVDFVMRPGATSADNRLYFSMKNASGFCKLWYLDTSNRIYQVSNIMGDAVTDGVRNLTYFNGFIYFEGRCNKVVNATGCATDGNYVLQKVNAAGDITIVLKRPDNASPASAQGLVWNNNLYWNGYKISTTDASKLVSAKLAQMTVFNNKLYGTIFNGCCTSNARLVTLDSSDNYGVPVNLSGFSSINSWVKIYTVMTNGSESDLYVAGKYFGSFFKLFRIRSDGTVQMMSNYRTGGQEDMYQYAENQMSYQAGFKMPTGPSGTNEFYYFGHGATGNYKLMKIYKEP